MYRILSLPIKQLSKSVVFVDTNPKIERIAVLKDNASLSQLGNNDTNVSGIARILEKGGGTERACIAREVFFGVTTATNYHTCLQLVLSDTIED